MLTGEPEYLGPLGDETPEGWIVTGYPVDSLVTGAHKTFATAYRGKFAETPKNGSVVGWSLVRGIAAGITNAGGTGVEAMADGFAGVPFETPFGRASFRALDHQSTMGAFVGRLGLKDGQGTMVDWRYVEGGSVLPGDAEVRAMRPG